MSGPVVKARKRTSRPANAARVDASWHNSPALSPRAATTTRSGGPAVVARAAQTEAARDPLPTTTTLGTVIASGPARAVSRSQK
ncbi:hypothetical protein GCM10011583_54780 [Streptomyces camponoticapitis]|uniref:Uncharacterized protein n=1 Tax=Streptomyces camponoticapitis TaxID=1616125 RepID=A0ABQ2ENX5_9ACTN|nr:hypothetical protein GCM10011583_54780 [Streptomyces camponoticapitis]